MLLSQKSQYALSAVFHLSLHYGEGPVKIAEIAAAQGIPPRFLEVILPQIKQGRFVASQRGKVGGYYLTREPGDISVGELLRFIEGNIGPVREERENGHRGEGHAVFEKLWDAVREAMEDIYSRTSFQDLVDEYRRNQEGYVPAWEI